MTGAKVVWILGAGFSRPLGGPLLADLFSEGWVARLKAAFGKVPFPRDAEGLAYLRRLGTQAGAWSDADELLDALDTAAAADSETAPSRRVFDPFLKQAFGGSLTRSPSVLRTAL